MSVSACCGGTHLCVEWCHVYVSICVYELSAGRCTLTTCQALELIFWWGVFRHPVSWPAGCMVFVLGCSPGVVLFATWCVGRASCYRKPLACQEEAAGVVGFGKGGRREEAGWEQLGVGLGQGQVAVYRGGWWAYVCGCVTTESAGVTAVHCWQLCVMHTKA